MIKWAFGESELESLLRRCREQDSDAWANLIERFKGLVYSVPLQAGLSEDDASDVFQHTFQALLSNLDRIENPQHLGRWLAVTAARESQRLQRVQQRLKPVDDPRTLEEVVEEEESGAEESAIRAMQTEEVHTAMKAMPERCRQLLRLLFFEDQLNYQEISERVNIPVGAIGPTRARCLEKLRKVLNEKGFFS